MAAEADAVSDRVMAHSEAEADDLSQRVREAAGGLEHLIARATAAQELRAKAQGAPRWTDVFTTQFTEFSNRPR